MKYLGFARNFSMSLLILTVFCISGWCNTICDFEYPQENQEFFGTIPETFTLICQNSLEKDVMLNGVKVTDYFKSENGKLICDGQKLSGFLKQGSNIIAIGQSSGPRIRFDVDTEGPQVKITQVEGENQLIIKGELKDPAGMRSLSVNDVVADIGPENTFSVSVSKADKYNFVAYDAGGHKSVTKYADRDTIVNDIVRLRINETAIHDILPVAQEVLEDVDFNAALSYAGLTTLFRERVKISLPKVVLVPRRCFGRKWWRRCTREISAGPVDFQICNLEASVVNLDLEELEITQMDLASGKSKLLGNWEGMTLDATMRNVNVKLRIKSDILGLSSKVRTILKFLKLERKLDAVDGNFTANLLIKNLKFKADVGLKANNGKVDATIVGIKSFGIGKFSTDSSLKINLPNSFNLFGLGLGQSVVNAITNGINDSKELLLNKVLLKNIGPALADPIVDLLVKQIQLHIAVGLTNGSQLSTLFAIQDIDIENNNTVMKVALNGRLATEKSSLDFLQPHVAISTHSPDIIWYDDHFLPDQHAISSNLGPCPDFAPKALGYLHTDQPVPDPQMKGDELALTISRNMMNQLMLAMYEAGLFNITISEVDDSNINININDDTNIPFNFTGLSQITGNQKCRVINTASSPPEIVFKGDEMVIPYLIINNFNILLQSNAEGEEWNDLFKATICARVPIAIHMVDSKLSAQLISPDVKLDIDVNNLLPLPENFDTDEYSNQVLINSLIEQVNLGLSQVILPLVLDLEYGGEKITVMPTDLYLPDPHIGARVNFNR
jgi:hypothetical protein